MKPITLYIKTHNVTGLKYFGKTTAVDPHIYQGSGTYWKRHIAVHGYNVTTEIHGIYTNKEDCLAEAIRFSQENDIVLSSEWANLMEESLDGGWDFVNANLMEYRKARLQEWRELLTDDEKEAYNRSRACLGAENGFYGRTWGENHPRLGAVLSQETKDKISLANKGKAVYIDKLTKDFMAYCTSDQDKVVSGEWIHINAGRVTSEETKQKLREASIAAGCKPPSAEGKIWWTNGTEQILSEICPDGYRKGRVEKSLSWFNNGIKSTRAAECPEGFVPGRLSYSKKKG